MANRATKLIDITIKNDPEHYQHWIAATHTINQNRRLTPDDAEEIAIQCLGERGPERMKNASLEGERWEDVDWTLLALSWQAEWEEHQTL